MKSSNIKRNMGRLTNSACALLFAGAMFVSCDDELLTGMPSWLGSSIYEELQERGEFETTLRLINDPVFAQEGLPTILGQTGSRTMLVANDEAYARFFQSDNDWGVHKYEDLSDAQKKLLLRTSLLNNAYLMELLSNTTSTSGDMTLTTGQALRHTTSVTLYDTIQVLKPEEMPSSSFWNKYRNKNMLVLRDATVPMISHYLPAYMSAKQITSDDLSFLTNGAYSDVNSSYVSGLKVVEQDITCQNGYIQVLEDVMQPLTSMAEVIDHNPNYTRMKSFLDRFAFPEYNESASREYNRLYNNGLGTDSVFTWRYLNYGFNSFRSSTASTGDYQAVRVVDGETAGEWSNLLPYDPGWNLYVNGSNTSTTAYEDMAVFIVPTDQAFDRYVQEGAGKVLMDNFGSWENVPDNIVAKLMQNLMKNSLVATVPSKFHTVMNTAQQPFFSTQEDIDAIQACHLATNGVIYESNKVFSAPDYVSVSFPVLLDDNTKIIRRAITDLEFSAYLNSMDSKYTFIAPTDQALSHYIDPVDIHKSQTYQSVAEFYYDDEQAKIRCKRYYLNPDGTKGNEITNATLSEDTYIQNRMRDILDNSIIIGNVEDSLRMGYHVFTTKGGSVIEFDKNVTSYDEQGIKFTGPYQIETGVGMLSPRATNGRYDMTESSGNGVTYIVDEAPVMPASKSVLSVLEELKNENSDYEEFYEMLAHSGIVAESYDKGNRRSNGMTVTVMSNYKYTIYAPTTASIQAMYAAGTLPDFRTAEDKEAIKEEFRDEWAGLDEEDIEEKVEAVIEDRLNQIDNFLRYHIQNSAVYLGSDISETKYETTLMNTSYGRFYSLSVMPGTGANSQFRIRSNGYDGNAIAGVPYRNVISTENHYAREYQFQKASGDEKDFASIDDAQTIYNSSFAVIHLIDGPLLYDAQMLPGSNNGVNKRTR